MGLSTKQLFEESLKSKHSIESYSWYVNEYVKYYKLASWDSILEFPLLEIQQMIQTYIVHVKTHGPFEENLKPISKSGHLQLNNSN